MAEIAGTLTPTVQRLPRPYFQRNGITIYHGDALEILPELRGGAVDLIVTDPPYVIGAVSAGNMASKSGGWGDMMNSSRWFRDWYCMAKRLLKPTGAFWTFCNWRSLPVVMKAGIDAEWAITSLLVWDKDWIGPGGVVGLRPSYELVALLSMPDFTIPNRGIPDIWKEAWSSFKPNGHPAEKPVSLLSRLIQVSGVQRDACILDPFMGSGSTIRAAANLGLSAVGIEAEEKWCEIAASRLSQEVMF